MNKRKEALNTLDEMVQILERLDISFLAGADKVNTEYAINEAIIDIQEIEGMVDDEEVLVFES
jgi:hypothetical protein